VTVALGETATGWVKLENTGSAAWAPGVVWLAPIPRDQASPFASPSWQSPTRISTVTAEVAPGQVGQFALDITGSVEGQSILSLGWVAEALTWFADAPRGGGPEDGYFAVDVNVVPGADEPAMPVRDAAMPDSSAPVRDAGPGSGASDGGDDAVDAGGFAGDSATARGDASDEHAARDASSDGCRAAQPGARSPGTSGRASAVWLAALLVLCVLGRHANRR
jgi:hypothetical protein